MKAIINNIPAFDVTEGTTGSFVTNSYITGFDLIIMDKTNTTKICDDIEVRESVNVFTIPANIGLINGESYLLYIKTYEKDGREFTSDPMIIKCFSTPIFNINVPNDYILTGTTFNVGIEYSQKENEYLNYYYIIAKDENNNTVFTSDYIYNIDKDVEINDLQDNSTYILYAYGKTVNGMKVEHSIQINTSFIKNEAFTMLRGENNYKNASVDLNISIKNALYRFGNPNNVEYIESNGDKAINLNNNTLEYYDGFVIDGDFSIYFEFTPSYNQDEKILNLNNDEMKMYFRNAPSPYFEFRVGNNILIIDRSPSGDTFSHVYSCYRVIIIREDGHFKFNINGTREKG